MATLVSTGQLTIIDVNDGASYSLTSDSTVMSADSAGLITYLSGAETSFKIAEAGKDTTSDWSYHVSGTGGGISYRDSDDTADRSAIGTANGGLGGANLMLCSNADSAAGWAIGPNLSKVGNTEAPDGTNTASVYTGVITGNAYIQQAVALLANTTYTVSCYAKLVSGSIPAVGQLIVVDRDTDGVAGTYERTTLPFVGSGLDSTWRKFSLTLSNVAAINGLFYLCTDFGNGAHIAIWGAQLEAGAVATEYTPSHTSFTGRSTPGTYYNKGGLLVTAMGNEARYSYNPSNLSAGPALLLERSSENLLTYSESVALAPWTKAATILASAVTNPAGGGSADKVYESATTSTFDVYKTLSVTIGAAYTLSIFLKAAERNIALVSICTSGLASGVYAYFDLNAGTVLSTVNTGTNVGGYASISYAGNGWYRCSVSMPSAALTTTYYPAFSIRNIVSAASYAGTAGSGFYVWGAQLETGTAPTSYISTSAASATRDADVFTSEAQSGTRGLVKIAGLTQDASYLDITASKLAGTSVTKRFSVTKSKTGATGSGLSMTATAQGFTYTDGIATPASQYIGFSVTGNAGAPVNFYTSNGVTLLTDLSLLPIANYSIGTMGAGDGSIAYLDIAQFGSEKQVIVTAVVGTLSVAHTVVKLDYSTAQGGATRNIYRGDWSNGILYDTGDTVIDGGSGWSCLVGHTSATGTNKPPAYPVASNAWWSLVSVKGDAGKTYTMNITGGVRNVTYDAAGATPSPAQSAFTAVLYEDGAPVSPTAYAWSCGGHLSGTSTLLTFTPTCAGTFSASNNDWVAVSMTYAGQTVANIIPVAITKIGSNGTNGASGYTLLLSNCASSAPGTVSKVSGVNAVYDAQAYSAESYSRGVFVSARASQTTKSLLFGLNTDPTLDANFLGLDYSWFCGPTGTSLDVIENGVSQGLGSSYSSATVLAITYDGVNVRYLKDGVVIRTVARAVGQPLYFDSSFSHLGGALNSLQFGPMGEVGAAAISGYLTSDSVTLAADSAGVVGSYATATGTFKVMDGAVDKTGVGVTYSVFSQTSCVVAINAATGAYTTTSIAADAAAAVFRAVYAGVTIDKVFTLVKAKSGSIGTNGTRGSRTFYVSGQTVWSAAAATTAASVDSGPVINDIVTEYGTAFSQTAFWNGTAWAIITAALDGNLLVTGSIGAGKLAANAVEATNVNVTNLASINSDLGAITAGSLSINGRFVVDALGATTISSAASGARLEIKNNVIKVYDSAGTLRVQLGDLSV